MAIALDGHLFGDRLDVVADALDATVRAAGVYLMSTRAEIHDFAKPEAGRKLDPD